MRHSQHNRPMISGCIGWSGSRDEIKDFAFDAESLEIALKAELEVR